MSTPTRTQVANKVFEVAKGVDPIGYGRGIDDIPKDFARADGAREVAVLTLTAISHDYEFKPVMAALEKLAALEDWSHSFFVAHIARNERPTFDWREAPMRKYESFADFYQRELEHTFGTWENLQHTWAKIVKGEITEPQGREIIQRSKMRASRGGDQRSNNKNATTLIGKDRGRPYTMARLDRDRPDLAAKVDAGLMTSNAAAIEAGFRKPRPSRKLTGLDRLRSAWAKASEDERKIFRDEITRDG